MSEKGIIKLLLDRFFLRESKHKKISQELELMRWSIEICVENFSDDVHKYSWMMQADKEIFKRTRNDPMLNYKLIQQAKDVGKAMAYNNFLKMEKIYKETLDMLLKCEVDEFALSLKLLSYADPYLFCQEKNYKNNSIERVNEKYKEFKDVHKYVTEKVYV